ncbi:hypothetical protein RHGRI_019946 [Rhododendron griersonianum]|uniref:Uncharacterized protein n=1 Tax=Rhododendron griersonianum TaxID=479676 RepID=A0AAV6JJW5_9ERIC|nr:hypothetical protein RHGRI_019946 [Rhododendron griersonianum]
MAISTVSFGVVGLFALVFAISLSSIQALALAPAPAPVSDGTTIDQGIPYALMLVALALTYLIHNLYSPSSFSF